MQNPLVATWVIITQLATYVILDARTPFLSEKQSFLRKIGVFPAIFGTKMHRLTAYATKWQLGLL